ncbi:MAG TPA: flagellar M-ring protein FliF [Phycisphaerales bacterium]|nr:flagellar M-ring protein FliF [Phycisphaerales bacterium]
MAEFLHKIRAIWEGVSIVQRALLIALVLAMAGISAVLVYWAKRPDMRLLYSELSPEDAAKITDKIVERGLRYELRSSGTSVYVPQEHVHQLRLDMAKDGLPVGEQSGYRIFEKEKIGVSPFVQNVNLKRALQEELAKSIQMIDGIVHARLHIVTGEQTAFAVGSARTSAAVVLKLKPGYKISATNVAAITHLVSGAVEGLRPDAVTIVDSQGQLLSRKTDAGINAGGAETVHDFRERVETSLSSKVEDMLTLVLGPNRASVRVSAVIDMNSVSTVKETYDPTGKVITSEEITSGQEPVAGGQTAGASSLKKDETIKTEYEVGKTVTQETILPGSIKSLSVAAFVDLSLDDPDPAQSGQTAGKLMQVEDVQEIIKNALGLSDTSAIKVIDVKFSRSTGLPAEEQGGGLTNYLEIARQASMGTMAICALVAFRLLAGPRKKVAQVKAGRKAMGKGTGDEMAAAAIGAGSVAMAALPGSPDGQGEQIAVRRQIALALKEDPERVRQLFASWLEERS